MYTSQVRNILLKPFLGIKKDLHDRLPYYKSDWLDSLDYRVIPSVIETYFNNLLPALAFAQDMFDKTDNSYGVNEVLLSSAMAGIIFGIFGGQPLCIVGVTGPISIFNYTIYQVFYKNSKNAGKYQDMNYFGFMFWVYIWSMIFHFITASLNFVCALQYVTNFPCDIFGLFINIIYIIKGIELLGQQFYNNNSTQDVANGFANVVVALCMALFGTLSKLIVKTHIFNHKIRLLISDYSTCLSVIFWTGFIHFGNGLSRVEFKRLPITKSFYPTSNDKTWLAYHKLSTGEVFLALPFGIILTILFYFDHNVSSLMAQRSQYKLKKPSTFHYDYFLLGITTGIAGILGVPAPNGLIPQAPLHTESLLVWKNKRYEIDDDNCVELNDGTINTVIRINSGNADENALAKDIQHESSWTLKKILGYKTKSTIDTNISTKLVANDETGDNEINVFNATSSGSPNRKMEYDTEKEKQHDTGTSDLYVERCVEQRFTNTVQGLMILGTMTRPLLVCLGEIPQAVLSGLFFTMGINGILNNTIVSRILYILSDNKEDSSALSKISTRKIIIFVFAGLCGAAAEVGISNSKGAIGFPLILLLTVIATFTFPVWFSQEEIKTLDSKVAQEFTLKNIIPHNLLSS
ncbi:related to Boron transporter 1 [Saccharomycodes ludwigii]|uniref:Related to Boron transporter 1 n=1 Tax=Saccharomycodes ludwigii TaxID=36035 RepID=A0A376BBS4_9ASCO|nr:hypothetical protein SCDLUD_003883 [Saccharomycodes ludwigii]KAH3899603.1 hypothetical protein SCDLUD_003883 [Saccharomycodes ludwigii]SSD62077.1 related to Boron transporter 1 [Saccharomycodes ludwigii]